MAESTMEKQREMTEEMFDQVEEAATEFDEMAEEASESNPFNFKFGVESTSDEE